MLAALTLVFGYPVVRLLIMSLQRTSGGATRFVGLMNYRAMFRDDVFLQAAKNNLTLLLCVPIMVFVALVLAVFLFERIRGWQFYRTTLFLPYLLPITVVGLIFSYIFQLSGVLNEFLKLIGLGGLAVDWLGSSPLGAAHADVRRDLERGGLRRRPLPGAPDVGRGRAVRRGEDRRGELVAASTAHHRPATGQRDRVLHRGFGDHHAVLGVQLRVRDDRRRPGSSTMVTELYVYLMGFRYNQMSIAAAVSILLLLVTGVFIFLELRLRAGDEAEGAA